MNDDETNWRQRSIDEFMLAPIPEEWLAATPGLGEISNASNDIWMAYYSQRMTCKKRETEFKNLKDDDDDVDIEAMKELWHECRGELEEIEEDIRGVNNGFPWFENVYFEITDYVPDPYGCDDLQTAEYKSIVWSSYAIPRAIELEHRYHRRARYSTMEFYATWSYRLKDLTSVFSSANGGMTQICSNCYEDQELRFDAIETGNLTPGMVRRLRNHLFGTTCPQSKEALDDFSFMRLIFASMATPNFETVQGEIGHSWRPEYNSELEKQIVAEGIVKSRKDIDCIPWLEYEVRRVTDALRPIDKYYQPPNIRDAPGYYARYGSDDD